MMLTEKNKDDLGEELADGNISFRNIRNIRQKFRRKVLIKLK